MTIDIVVGNPPYARMQYKQFMYLAHIISKLCSTMIIPITWIDIKDNAFNIMKCTCKSITYYPDAYKCFQIDQMGGIMTYICLKDNIEEADSGIGVSGNWCSIPIKNIWSKIPIHTITLTRRLALNNNEICLLNIASTIIEKVLSITPKTLTNSNYINPKIDEFGLTKSIPKARANTHESAKSYVELVQSGKSYGKLPIKELIHIKNIDKFKLCVHDRLGYCILPCNKDYIRGLKKLYLLQPYQAPVISDVTLVYGDSEEELTPFYKYYNTKFFKFLAFAGNTSSHYTHLQLYKFIPMQNFTYNSDIDWHKPIADIDKQLYTKYKLTQLEISAIECTIR